MNMKELMIGDWVYNSESNLYQRVDELHYDCVVLDEYCTYDYADLAPIRITEEILEKNGFKLKEEGESHTEYVSGDEHSIIEFVFFKESVHGVDTVLDCELGFVGGLDRIHHCHVKYVHELQHALRLCGITKSIEL